jgi:hypothetical protein
MEDAVMQERTLTVIHHVTEGRKTVRKRITLAPNLIHFVIAGEEAHSTYEGRELRKANVVMTEGNNLELYISLLDLNAIERCVGSYFLP